MGVMERLRALDERALGRRLGHRPRRRTVLIYGTVMGIFGVACYVGSFADDSLARAATIGGTFAGLALGRVQEFDLTRKGLGLRGDDEEPPGVAR